MRPARNISGGLAVGSVCKADPVIRTERVTSVLVNREWTQVAKETEGST